MNRPKNKNFSSDGKKSTTQEFPNKKKGGMDLAHNLFNEMS